MASAQFEYNPGDSQQDEIAYVNQEIERLSGMKGSIARKARENLQRRLNGLQGQSEGQGQGQSSNTSRNRQSSQQ